MGLLNDVKQSEAKSVEQVKDNNKAARKEAAKERKIAKQEAVKRIVDYLVAHPVPELAKDVELLSKAPVRAGGFAPALTPEVLFGDKVRVSALEVFTKHKKGFPEMRKYIKKWAEKGITVTLDATTQEYVWKK